KAIATGLWNYSAFDLVDAWRMSHAFPLNTFQMSLRRRAKRVQDKPAVVVGQRLKRFSSIRGKLMREPTMALSTMQDIGGCRAVVASMAAARSLADLFVEGGCSISRNYIDAPKPDGYRSVHRVGKYGSDSEVHSAWNGKRIEIEVRTSIQHIFATGMETVTTFTGTPLKFGGGDPQWRRFLRSCALCTHRARMPRPFQELLPRCLTF